MALVQMSHDMLAPPDLQRERAAQRAQGKRAVTIEGDTDAPFGISYQGKTIDPYRSHESPYQPRNVRPRLTSPEESPEDGSAAAASVPVAGAARGMENAREQGIQQQQQDAEAAEEAEVYETGELTLAEKEARGRAAAINLIDSSDDEQPTA